MSLGKSTPPYPRQASITPRRREQVFRVLDGCNDERLLRFCYHLDQHYRSDEIFDFMYRQRLVGRNLLSKIEEEDEGRFIWTAMTRIVNMMEKETRPMYLGRDF